MLADQDNSNISSRGREGRRNRYDFQGLSKSNKAFSTIQCFLKDIVGNLLQQAKVQPLVLQQSSFIREKLLKV